MGDAKTNDKMNKKTKKWFTIISFLVTLLCGIATFWDLNETLKNIAKVIMVISLMILVILFVSYLLEFYRKLSNKFKALVKFFKKLDSSLPEDTQEYNSKIPEQINTFDRSLLCPVQNSNFKYITEEVTSMLQNYLSKNVAIIKELHIICYGRNGYDTIVNHIINAHWDIAVKIIVYNSKSCSNICRWELKQTTENTNGEDVWKNTDEDDIWKNVKRWMNNSKNITVIASKIPPMIRAAVVYTQSKRSDKENELRAIWGSIQSYRFALNEDAVKRNDDKHKLFLEKPRHSLICVCEEKKTVKADFDLLVDCFEEEFERLGDKHNSYKVKPKGNGIELVDWDE